jgi:hypothetical protein
MKKIFKWILFITGVCTLVLILTATIFSYRCNNPSVEPTPVPYISARKIWTNESRESEIALKYKDDVAKIFVTHVPTDGTTIQYKNENEARKIFPHELYFGASEIKFDESSGIIYVKVVGQNAACGPFGERIYEYDFLRRQSIRDYWVKISK